MYCSRSYRDLVTRINFGFGHDLDKTPGIGNLANFCPACPQPGYNLPPDWEDDPAMCVIYWASIDKYGLGTASRYKSWFFRAEWLKASNARASHDLTSPFAITFWHVSSHIQLRSLRLVLRFSQMTGSLVARCNLFLPLYCVALPLPLSFLFFFWAQIASRYAYKRQIVTDENFKAQNTHSSRPDQDICLYDGEGYMVDKKPYCAYLSKVLSWNEVGFLFLAFYCLM